jgi:CheY-like chemotaxis protein
MHDAAMDRAPAAFETPIKAAAGTTILIVEDEADVRDLLATSLASFGYHAVVARDAAEAMAILASETPLGLLFSDIVLPGSVNGVELARQARQLRQDLKVLLTSGHPREHHGGAAGFEFLAKPYTPRMLAGRIHELLDADPPTPDSRESPSGSGAGP